jgi:hypothetical protein
MSSWLHKEDKQKMKINATRDILILILRECEYI